MKFKTGEKVYGGLLSFFFAIGVITTLFKEGDIPVEVYGETKMISKMAFVGYMLLGYVIIFVPIGLIVRGIVNRDDGKRERERERDKNVYTTILIINFRFSMVL